MFKSFFNLNISVPFIAGWVILTSLLFSTSLQAQNLENLGKNKPLTISGSISLNSSFYNISDGDPRRSPFSWNISGSPVINIYGISFPMGFSVTREQGNFRHPFQQYGVSPHYKWIKVHLGHRNMRFSPYTLSGKTFYGAGIELNPGGLRASAMIGRFNEATLEDSLYNVSNLKYEQKGYAFKLGFGSSADHVDFILFKAEDDSTSVSNEVAAYTQVRPEENVVLGIDVKKKLFKQLSFHFSGASSAFSRDAQAEEIESSELDQSGIRAFFNPNYSSRLNFAWETGLSAKIKRVKIKAGYKRVDPGYRSLGANYILADNEHLSLGAGFHLWKNKIHFNGDYGIQRDNLTAKKSAQTIRNVGSVNLNFNPAPTYGVTLAYSNYAIDQQPGLTEINDTIRVVQVSRNFSVMPRWSLLSKNFMHNVVWVNSLQDMDDRNPFTEEFSEYKVFNSNLQYSLNWVSLGLGLNSGFHFNRVTNALTESGAYGLNLGASKSFGPIKLGFNTTFNLKTLNQQNNGNDWRNRLTAGLRHGRHGFNFSFNYSSRNYSLTPSSDEFSGNCSYIFSLTKPKEN